MKLTDLSPENRPRERLEHAGVAALSNAELLAIILKSGTKNENVLELSHKLLAKYGLEKLATCTIPELAAEHGIGKAKACQLIALFELFRRYTPQSQFQQPITCSKDIATRYLSQMQHLNKEHFRLILLDVKNNIFHEETITIGLLNSSLVHPREVFQPAIKQGAAALIVLHNHPSGDPQPSNEDIQVTQALQKAGNIIDIRLLDHIILGKNSWWSWKEGEVRVLDQ